VLVVTRFSVAEADGEQFAGQARAALGALAARPGYLRGHLGRAIDDPSCWLLLTEWDGVGAYRRALSAYDVRVQAIPVLALGQPEPGAFEVLTTVDHAGAGLVNRSDRAADADTAGPGAPQAAPAAQPTQLPRQGQRPEALDQPGGAVAPDPLRPDDPTGQEMP
jgi:Antibiotic biosynthesis monooxygenase